MSTRTYWSESRFVVEWTLTDDAGNPVSTATVTGVVQRPTGASASMTVTNTSNVYLARYTVAEAGRHGWKLTATGTAVGAEGGSFVAKRDIVGLPAITVDPATDVGYMRILITDLDEAEPLFEDAQLSAIIGREKGIKRAASAALKVIAASEALISKKIRTQDLSTDGPAVAKELRELAKALRAEADAEDGGPSADEYGLEIAEFDPWAAYRDPE